MGKTFVKGIVAAIIIIGANVGLFAFTDTYSTSFWISYAFIMLATIITAYIEVIYVSKETCLHAYEVSAITLLYLVAASIAGVKCFLTFGLFPIRTFFIQFAIFAVFLILLMVDSFHSSQVKDQQAKRSTELTNFRYILENMKSAASKMDYSNPQRKMVMHAYDSLASGQVSSKEIVFDIENSIIDAIEELKSAITNKDDEKVNELCSRIEELSEERKSKLIARRPF